MQAPAEALVELDVGPRRCARRGGTVRPAPRRRAASVRSSSRTTRPRPAPSSAAARASIPITSAGGASKRGQPCTSRTSLPARRARRPQPDLPRPRRDRRHGDRRARADRGDARRRRRPAYRFTAFVNRETAGRRDGRWGELLPDRDRARARPPARAMGARRAGAAAAAGDARRRRARAQPRQHRAAVGPLPPRGDDPRPDLRPLSRGPQRHPRQGHAAARARPPRGARTA